MSGEDLFPAGTYELEAIGGMEAHSDANLATGPTEIVVAGGTILSAVLTEVGFNGHGAEVAKGWLLQRGKCLGQIDITRVLGQDGYGKESATVAISY